MVEETRAIGWRQVLMVAGIAVAAVLVVAAISIFVPAVGDVFAGTPILVIVLVAATAFVLWGIATRRPPEP